MDKLAGVFCAFWTPVAASGEVLWDEFDRHLDWVLKNGVHGIMALGSTGDFVHLSIAERKAILERTVRACNVHAPNGRCKVIANVSDPQHRRAIDLVVHAAESGAAVAAVLPPWYYAMEDRDVAEFFATVGRASNLPLMLYNYPEMTGKKISLEIIRQVAGTVPVVAVKQSGAEFRYHDELLLLGKELGFVVLSGADTRFEEVLKLGCTGTISGLANAAPQALHTIYENFRLGTSSPAESRLIASIAHAIRDLAFPLNVQAAIAGRGFETGVPKNPISKKTQEAYDLAVSKIREIFQSE